MTIGLLDLGSNTIKLAVYEVENGRYTNRYYDATYAGIIGFVEQNRLTAEGITKIIAVLNAYKPVAEQQGCSVLDCFSTASLRYIENQSEVLDAVEQATGLEIRPLSGEEEALFNAYSMRRVVPAGRFVGADLGGGSLQLFCWQEGLPIEGESYPLGALKMYKQFVSGTFPTVNEMMAIKAFVLHTLEQGCFKQGSRILYQMGGTARMIAQMLGGGDRFTVTELETAITGMISNHTLAENTIAAVNPDRRLTILPGMIVIYAMADYLQANTVVYTQNSVREGFLLAHYIERNEHDAD